LVIGHLVVGWTSKYLLIDERLRFDRSLPPPHEPERRALLGWVGRWPFVPSNARRSIPGSGVQGADHYQEKSHPNGAVTNP
jgi:hypothetical protein